MVARALRPLLPLTAALLVGACRGGSPGSSGPSPDRADEADPSDGGSQASALASLTVSTGILRPAFDPDVTDYDVTSLNSVYPVSVTATTSAPGSALTIHGSAARSGEPAPFTLRPREDIPVVVETPGLAARTYTVHYVPSDFPTYRITSSPAAGTEDVLLNPNGEYVMIVDRSGAPLYYRTFLPYDLENFQQSALPGGAVVYSLTVGVIDPSGWTLGVDHVMNDHFEDIADYQLPAYAEHGILPAEGHELLVLGDQHYVAISYVERTLDLSPYDPTWSSKARVMSDVMQEVDHGEVLFEWDSANVPALYADSVYDNAFGPSALSDYLHLNSVDIDPADGNFVVSFRHASSIAKLDRHTGQILWTLGGKEDDFGLTPDQTFSMQHHVRMHPDGTMTVFDNGNRTLGHPAHPTRIPSFTLDGVHHEVTSYQVLYTKPSDQPPTGFMGSATPLSGDRLFVGWGGWYTSQLEPSVTEIVGGAAVWSLQFDETVTSYRALPILPL